VKVASTVLREPYGTLLCRNTGATLLFFVLMILAFVLVGDGLRDVADPYSEEGR
jgi:hypothetical protein